MANSEKRACQNCKCEFEIDASDFKFYEKIQVPPPTFCPECRLQRRLAFFNIFNLYQRKCDLCKQETISMYAPDSPYAVYCPPCWWSDEWSGFDYGRDYDFSRPFFEQFQELWHKVPLLGLSIDIQTMKTSPWNNHAGDIKSSYLLFHAGYTENSAYGFYVDHCNEILDSSAIISCELCYDSMHSYKDSRCVGSRSQVVNCIDCFFLKDSFNCQNCFASANLRNKKFHIFNKPYSGEKYFEEIKKWNLGSFKTYKEIQKLAEDHWKLFPPKPVEEEMSVNSSGSHFFQSKNCQQCFEVVGAEDSKFLFLMPNPPIKDCYDISSWGDNLSLSYECSNVGEQASGLKFCNESGLGLVNAEYCKLSTGGSNHFGCVSVKKGDYIILNKRYEKEEYEKLRLKIIQHMSEMPYVDKKGRIYKYGEFFPIELSPFAYNETIASNFFPMSKEEVEANGYKWKEPEIKTYSVTIPAENLPDHIKDAPDSILDEVIGCNKCERGFRVIPMELKFLRERNLPLPRQCPFCRIQEKFNIWVRNLRLIERICDKCGATFQTKYTKEEAPIVYCKKCYQNEVI
ncbi:hypothetical protein HYW53_00595 [Candidatus Giovannonibacteria bacterium]|nr:hypothetical protein [Candidatus Giovannonibacteria bacterium]